MQNDMPLGCHEGGFLKKFEGLPNVYGVHVWFLKIKCLVLQMICSCVSYCGCGHSSGVLISNDLVDTKITLVLTD